LAVSKDAACNDATLAAMQRRTLLGLGLAGTALLAAAGGAAAWLHEGAWRDGKLLPAGRRVLESVALAVLAGSLPDDSNAQAAAIAGHLTRMEAMINAMPSHTQHDLANLLALLAMPPLRSTVVGLHNAWETASLADVQAALQSMRQSSLLLRRQAYGALRDLTHAAYFADASTWSVLRYPGPRALA
jgi:hypothetical protein